MGEWGSGGVGEIAVEMSHIHGSHVRQNVGEGVRHSREQKDFAILSLTAHVELRREGSGSGASVNHSKSSEISEA